jgi:Protein of unknown function (DUF1559)
MGESFKQQCPTCEAMVLIKSTGLVGKKMECPKCKDNFVVAAPATSATPPASKSKLAKSKAAETNDADEYEEFVRPAPAAKKRAVKSKVADEEEEFADAESDEEEETAEAESDVGEARPKRIPAKGKVKDEHEAPRPTKKVPKGQAKPANEESDDETPADETGGGPDASESAKPQKKLFGLDFAKLQHKLKGLRQMSRKTAIGTGLAVVGFLVLIVAGWLMIPKSNDKGTSDGKGKAPPPQAGGPGKKPHGPGKGVEPKDKKDEKPPSTGDIVKDPPKKPLAELSPSALANLTNILPPDAEQVVQLSFANLLNPQSLFYEAAFKAGPFREDDLKAKLGFSVLKVDEVIQAERFTSPAWSFTIVHLNESFDLDVLTKALKLKPVVDNDLKSPAKKDKKSAVNLDYFTVGDNPWLEQLGRLAPGVPSSLRQLGLPRQTQPLYLHLRDRQTLILADKQPLTNYLQEQKKKAGNKTADEPKDAYSTVDTKLRIMLKALSPNKDAGDQLLFASATLMQNAEEKSKQQAGLIRYRPRPFWDVTALMAETRSRLDVMGVALASKGKQSIPFYQYRTDLICVSNDDARDLQKELNAAAVPLIDKALTQFLKMKVKIEVPGKRPPVFERAVYMKQDKSTVRLVVGMNLERETGLKRQLTDYLALLLKDADAELVLTAEKNDKNHLRHQLSKAARRMAEDPDAKWRQHAGLNGKGPGQYPPGAFPLAVQNRPVYDPGRRISWMAGLLPYLGQQSLYDVIHFDSSWDDFANFPAGRTLVPQFIDPSYPPEYRYVSYADSPQAYGATHFVGIAGVGLDAGDPVLGSRRGILGEEQSASLKEVASGRGLANTIFMIQVPYDSLPGITPWIAGGSNLRGVPESKSIEPFVAKGGKGTYVLTADGSVRFVTRDISDQVFQAMCTYQGPPDASDFKSDAALVPEPTP